MSLIVNDNGLYLSLSEMVTAWNSVPLKLRLFTSGTAISRTIAYGSLSECTFSGYAAVDLTGWTTPSVSSNIATTQADPVVFIKSGATTGFISGYYVTDAAGTVVYWGENDASAPIAMTIDGQSYTVVAKFSVESKYS